MSILFFHPLRMKLWKPRPTPFPCSCPLFWEKSLRRPGIEPGSIPWEGTIMPLDQRRVYELSFCNLTEVWHRTLKSGRIGDRTLGLPYAKRTLYH